MIVGTPICPILDFTCPYYEQNYCTLENPVEECDDYAMRYDDEEEEQNLLPYLCLDFISLKKD